MFCSIRGCPNELSAHSRLRTCPSCRQNLHFWDKKPIGQIFGRAQRLTKYRARLNTIAAVGDEEGDVVMADHETLVKRRIMVFPIRKARRQARAVATKLRARGNEA